MSKSELNISHLIQDVKNANENKRLALRPGQLLRIDELSKLTTLSKSCINLWVAQGKLIPPITLSPTVKVWVLQDVIDWVDSQKNNKSNVEIQS